MSDAPVSPITEVTEKKNFLLNSKTWKVGSAVAIAAAAYLLINKFSKDGSESSDELIVETPQDL